MIKPCRTLSALRMKSTLHFWLAALIFILCGLWSSAFAHAGDRIVPIYEIPSSDLPNLQDGTLEDWEDILILSSITETDLRQTQGPIDPGDLAFRAHLAWHDASQRLLAGIAFVDDEFLKSEWVQIMVDGDHSGGEYDYSRRSDMTEEDRGRLNNSQAQSYHLSYIFDRERPGVYWYNTPTQWVVEQPWVEVGGTLYGENPAQFLIETAVTAWDSVSSDGSGSSKRSLLAPDKVIGIEVLVVDHDPQDADPMGNNTWVPTIYTVGGTELGFGTASRFADGLLIPCYELDCSRGGTVVRPSSWARIKAAVRQ